MTEIRIHGLGGQGVVTAAEILSLAGWQQGYWAQAMPSFGPERTGAPVAAFLRFDQTPILTREPITQPSWLILTTDKLLDNPLVQAGTDRRTKLLVNSALSLADLQAKLGPSKVKLYSLDAKNIAEKLASPLAANSALLGGWIALSGIIELPMLQAAIADKLQDKNPDLIKINQHAAREGYEQLYGHKR